MAEKQSKRTPRLTSDTTSALPVMKSDHKREPSMGSDDTNVEMFPSSIEKPGQAHGQHPVMGDHDVDAEPHSPSTEKPRRPSGPSRQESEFEYPPFRSQVIVMIAILLAIFLMALDRTIIATAIPAITDDFGSLDDIGWYGSAYMLTICCFQLLIGRIYTFYTPKYVFLGTIGVFEIGSALCGAAPSSVAFIIGRAIAGIGGAGMMSGALILLVTTIPLAQRPKWMGAVGGMFGLASIAGPLLGGAFTTAVSWRWCFYINLPIGGLAIAIIFFILKPAAPTEPGLTIKQQVAKIDLLGQFCLLPSIICLLLALQWGGTTYAWNNGRIIALFVVFAVTLVGFVLVQIFRQETAIIPASTIKNRSMIAGMWMTFCISSTLLIIVYWLPTWFQAIKGESALQSGIDTLPMILFNVFGNIVAGQITGRTGYYTSQAWACMVVMPIGAGLIYTFTPETSKGMWVGYQIIFGVGVGFGMQQGNMAAQTVLSRKDVPIGVSLMMLMQQLGGAIFVSVGQNVFDTKLVSELSHLDTGLSPYQIVNTGATNLRSIVPASQLPDLLKLYNSALRQVFLVGIITACLASIGGFALEWKSVKGKEGPGAGKAKAAAAEAEPKAETV